MISIEALFVVIIGSLVAIALLGAKCYEIKVELNAFRKVNRELHNLLDSEDGCWCENLDFPAASQEGRRLSNNLNNRNLGG